MKNCEIHSKNERIHSMDRIISAFFQKDSRLDGIQKNRMTIFSALNCEIHSTDRIISAWYMINRTSPSLFSFNRKDSRYLYALRRIEWLYLPRAANYEIHSKREYSEWSTERKLEWYLERKDFRHAANCTTYPFAEAWRYSRRHSTLENWTGIDFHHGKPSGIGRIIAESYTLPHYDPPGSRLKPSIYVMRRCRGNACIARPSTQGYGAC